MTQTASNGSPMLVWGSGLYDTERIWVQNAPDRVLLSQALLGNLDSRFATISDGVLTITAENGTFRYRLLPPVDADPVEAELLRGTPRVEVHAT